MWTKEKKGAREKQIGLKVCISHGKDSLASQGIKCESCNSGHLSDFAVLVCFILSPFRNFSSSFYELGILSEYAKERGGWRKEKWKSGRDGRELNRIKEPIRSSINGEFIIYIVNSVDYDTTIKVLLNIHFHLAWRDVYDVINVKGKLRTVFW